MQKKRGWEEKGNENAQQGWKTERETRIEYDAEGGGRIDISTARLHFSEHWVPPR